MANHCVICDEKLNLKNHKLVSCEYCDFGACKTCYQTFLPEQTAAKCMNRECGRVWTRKFLTNTFSQSFLQKDWRKSREKLAFDRETALLPATQEILERRLIIENARRENVILRKQIKTFQQNNYKIFAREARACKLSKKETQIMYLQAEPEDIQQLRERLDVVMQILNHRYSGTAATTTTNFVRGCPSEDCRGFLSSDWKCGLCKIESCSKCHVIKNKNGQHTCNPDDVATATLLNRDTKPCPKCHTGIFKIDGCDQMWCTQCHTAFSWKSGELESQIHNPHYYEWQRRNNGGVAPRVPGDVPHQCVQNHNLTQYTFRHITGLQLDPEITKTVGNIIRDIIHLRETEMRDYRPNPANDETVSRENRILFLRKNISKEIFIRRSLMETKKRESNMEIHQVLEMFVQVSTDIINRFIVLAQKRRQETLLVPGANDSDLKYNYNRLKRKIAEVETLRQFTNEALKEIYTTYKYKTREISFRDDVCGMYGTDKVLKTVESPQKKQK